MHWEHRGRHNSFCACVYVCAQVRVFVCMHVPKCTGTYIYKGGKGLREVFTEVATKQSFEGKVRSPSPHWTRQSRVWRKQRLHLKGLGTWESIGIWRDFQEVQGGESEGQGETCLEMRFNGKSGHAVKTLVFRPRALSCVLLVEKSQGELSIEEKRGQLYA